MISKEVAICIQMAAGSYELPPQLLEAIHIVEGGKIGLAVENTNGSKDFGPMQINSLWIKPLSKRLDATEAEIESSLQHDACFNVAVAADILDGHIKKNEDPVKAVGHYHSRTPKLRDRYSNKVIEALRQINSRSEKNRTSDASEAK